MLYPFSALLARMKYITRWSLMHSTRAESLSEHTCDTALLAHLLCLIAKHYTGTPCRPEVVAVAALYHDAPEIITGDMPTPVPARRCPRWRGCGGGRPLPYRTAAPLPMLSRPGPAGRH